MYRSMPQPDDIIAQENRIRTSTLCSNSPSVPMAAHRLDGRVLVKERGQPHFRYTLVRRIFYEYREGATNTRLA